MVGISMEQRKGSKSFGAGMSNNNSNRNSRGKEDDVVIEQSTEYLIHSQVRKIKREENNMVDWSPGQPELRPALREITRHIPRSPLGLSGMPISVGD